MTNKSKIEDQLIFWVEQNDAAGASPFRMVEAIQGHGFSRLEAIEIYRVGANAWSLDPASEVEEV